MSGTNHNQGGDSANQASEVEVQSQGSRLPPLAFSTLGCPDWSFEEMISNGVEYGYQGVEIRLLRRETDLLARPEFRSSELPLRRRQLADANFAVCGLSSSVRLHDIDKSEREKQISTGRAYCELARELGARFVRVFGDLLFPPGSDNVKPAVEVTELELAAHPSVARVADGLNRLGEHAQKTGVRILIETHGDFCRTVAMLAIMAKVTSPAVGVLWDTHHAWRFHHERLADTFQNLRPWIGHAHWKDSVTRAAPKTSQDADAVAAAARLAQQINPGHQHADYALFGGGEFPIRECLSLFKPPESLPSGEIWHSLEWEKMWHPQIEDPEIALRLFPPKFAEFWTCAKQYTSHGPK